MVIKDVTELLPRHKTKKYQKRDISNIDSIAVHHSLTDDLKGDKDIYAFARYHVNNHGWPGIGYHYVIDADGIIYKTNYWETKSYHVGNNNANSLGICLVGDFRFYEPTEKQLEALYELCGEIMDNLKNIDISRVKGHSEFEGYSKKACPVIDMNKVRSEITKRKGQNTTEVKRGKLIWKTLMELMNLIFKGLKNRQS